MVQLQTKTKRVNKKYAGKDITNGRFIKGNKCAVGRGLSPLEKIRKMRDNMLDIFLETDSTERTRTERALIQVAHNKPEIFVALAHKIGFAVTEQTDKTRLAPIIINVNNDQQTIKNPQESNETIEGRVVGSELVQVGS